MTLSRVSSLNVVKSRCHWIEGEVILHEPEPDRVSPPFDLATPKAPPGKAFRLYIGREGVCSGREIDGLVNGFLGAVGGAVKFTRFVAGIGLGGIIVI